MIFHDEVTKALPLLFSSSPSPSSSSKQLMHHRWNQSLDLRLLSHVSCLVLSNPCCSQDKGNTSDGNNISLKTRSGDDCCSRKYPLSSLVLLFLKTSVEILVTRFSLFYCEGSFLFSSCRKICQGLTFLSRLDFLSSLFFNERDIVVVACFFSSLSLHLVFHPKSNWLDCWFQSSFVTTERDWRSRMKKTEHQDHQGLKSESYSKRDRFRVRER